MRVLIIYAHPNHESFNDAVCRKTIAGLEKNGTDWRLIDLYAEKFDPVLNFGSGKKRSELKNDPETENYRGQVAAADHLIFIYPIWWSGMPAILKGFFDRVFVSGFAYTYQGMYPHGLLKNKTAVLIYSMDTPAFYARFFRGNIEWRSICGPILHFCGIRRVKRFVFYSTRTSSEERRKKFLDRIQMQAERLR